MARVVEAMNLWVVCNLYKRRVTGRASGLMQDGAVVLEAVDSHNNVTGSIDGGLPFHSAKTVPALRPLAAHFVSFFVRSAAKSTCNL